MRTIKELLTVETKFYLLLLKFFLTTLNSFNTAFQATTYTVIHLLHVEIKKLTKRLQHLFIDANVIDPGDITKTPFEVEANQLGDKVIEVGNEAQCLANIFVRWYGSRGRSVLQTRSPVLDQICQHHLK